MDPEGVTPWGMILALFAYATLGWIALAALHVLRRRRTLSAREAAGGYGASWNTSTQSNF